MMMAVPVADYASLESELLVKERLADQLRQERDRALLIADRLEKLYREERILDFMPWDDDETLPNFKFRKKQYEENTEAAIKEARTT